MDGSFNHPMNKTILEWEVISPYMHICLINFFHQFDKPHQEFNSKFLRNLKQNLLKVHGPCKFVRVHLLVHFIIFTSNGLKLLPSYQKKKSDFPITLYSLSNCFQNVSLIASYSPSKMLFNQPFLTFCFPRVYWASLPASHFCFSSLW